MIYAQRGEYHAIVWPGQEQLLLEELWIKYPFLVTGRYLVNTSLDSGHLQLSSSQKDLGWYMVGDLAHSPAIQTINEIPRDQFDEWLVFDSPCTVDSFDTMVNYYGFSPIDFEWKEKRELFWSQVTRLKPLHVFGQNDGTYFVSRDETAVRNILKDFK